MRLRLGSASAVLAASLFLLSPAACGEELTRSTVTAPRLDVAYRNCPTPATAGAACRAFHGENSVFTGSYCAYEGCFQISYGTGLRLVAADELGPFPRQWNAWLDGTVVGGYCNLVSRNKLTHVLIPDGLTKCTVNLGVNGQVYHEHFASNPTLGCLGWMECTEPPVALPQSSRVAQH